MNESPAQTAEAAETFRIGVGEKLFLVATSAFIGALALFLFVTAIVAFGITAWFGAVMALTALFVGWLWIVLIREAVAAQRVVVSIDGDEARLSLPRVRGHVPAAPVNDVVALAGMARIEHRLEAFTQIGVTALQRAYRIVMKDGVAIELGADRQMRRPFYAQAAQALARRARIALVDRGAVDAHPGVLILFGQEAPNWDTPSLAPDEIEKRKRRSDSAFRIMGLVAMLAILAKFAADRLS